MACIAEGVARLFSRFEPLEAYRLDILGSLSGKQRRCGFVVVLKVAANKDTMFSVPVELEIEFDNVGVVLEWMAACKRISAQVEKITSGVAVGRGILLE